MPFEIMRDVYHMGPLIASLYGRPPLNGPIGINLSPEGLRVGRYKREERPLYIVDVDKGQSGQKLQVWYLPYEPNQTHYTILDPRQATIMITEIMDGCTFGVGTATINGETIVCHANFGANDRTTQQSIQRVNAINTLNSYGGRLSPNGLRPKLVEPKDYRYANKGETSMLLFGIYSDGKSGWFTGKGGGWKWRFYRHTFIKGFDKWEIKKRGERIFMLGNNGLQC